MNQENIKEAAITFAGPRTDKNSSVFLVSKISFEAGGNWERMELMREIKETIEAIYQKSSYVTDWDQRAVPTKDLEIEFEKLMEKFR